MKLSQARLTEKDKKLVQKLKMWETEPEWSVLSRAIKALQAKDDVKQ